MGPMEIEMALLRDSGLESLMRLSTRTIVT